MAALPKWQSRFLRQLVASRDVPPAWGRSLRQLFFSFGGWALLLMLLMVIHPVIKPVLLFAAGVLIGIIATNLLIVRIAIRQWPILYRIVAWEKVESLLKEDQPSPPESA